MSAASPPQAPRRPSTPPLEPGELDRLLRSSGAYQEGHFQLSSGLHSPAYVQCARLLEEPARGRRVGAALARLLASLRPRSIVAPALGGLLIGWEVAAALDVPFRFVERKDGAMTLRRGFAFEPGERVAIVEDVVTTGRSTREAAAVVEAAGAEVVAVGAIIDRSGGSEDGTVTDAATRGPFDVPFFALHRLDFDTWRPEECPRCAAGEPAVKPGSRPGGGVDEVDGVDGADSGAGSGS